MQNRKKNWLREEGFLWTINIYLNPLHINLARTQSKKIWSASSERLHNEHIPSDGHGIWEFDRLKVRS
jgi:hypothetical protein